ncbi:MAG: response regulator [Gammaproteobacteria bacterium]|nr:response regulator [Gammaproteobacteria bacterium]
MRHEPCVIILDDEWDYDFVESVLNEMMERCNVHHFTDVDGAVDFIESVSRVDLVLTGWEIGGELLLKKLRSHPRYRTTPVIVMPENQSDNLLAAAVRANANDILPKPFTARQLHDKLDAFVMRLNRRRTERVKPDRQMLVHVPLRGVYVFKLELVDISMVGCNVRAPFKLSGMVNIYDNVHLTIAYESDHMKIQAQLIRLDYDPFEGDEKHIMIAFRFLDIEDESRERLQQMITDFWKTAQD